MSMAHHSSPLAAAVRRLAYSATLAIALGLFSTAILLPHAARSQSSATPFKGWLWSDNIGWISLNCQSDPGGCSGPGGSWGVTLNTDGSLTGFAWSDGIGWIQFGGLSAFPSGSGTSASNAVFDTAAHVLTGWVRACGGTQSGDCSSMTSRSDGWDGWISLNGTSYQINTDASGNFNPCTTNQSCAWGSDVVGWTMATGTVAIACTQFDPSSVSYCATPDASGAYYRKDIYGNTCLIASCTAPQVCMDDPIAGASCYAPPAASCNNPALPNCIGVMPFLIAADQTVQISWDVSDVQNDPTTGIACSVSGSNGDGPPAAGWTSVADASHHVSGTSASSPIVTTTTYTLTCLGQNGLTQSWSASVEIAPSFQER